MPMTLHEMLDLLDPDQFAEIEGKSMTATIYMTWPNGGISLVDIVSLEY